MTIKFTNNATTTLASGINSSATSLTVATGTGALFPSLSGSDVFYVTLANLTGTVEIVKVTARSSDTFTIVRAQDNTTATSWTTGDKVELRPTAVALTAMAQTANNLSDLASAPTARTNLGLAIGTDVQAYNANLQGASQGGISSFKNRIINGAMVIDQRNAGASITPTNQQYSVDRWSALLTAASKFTMQQNAASVTPPDGFTSYLGITSSSAYSVGAGDVFGVRQVIEGFNIVDLGWGTASAKAVTISFWVRSSLTGTFGASLLNGAVNRSYPFTYTISSANTWEQKTVTIAGDTSGTWATNNTAGIQLSFGLGGGATYSGTAGAWAAAEKYTATGATSVVGTNGATFYITGVQLEKGSTATSYDVRSYGTELALCQRYFLKTFGLAGDYVTIGGAGVVNGTTTGSRVQVPMFASMRSAPTLDVFSTSLYDASVVAAVTAVSAIHSTSNSYSADLTASGGGLTVGRPCMFLINTGATNYVSLSAEL